MKTVRLTLTVEEKDLPYITKGFKNSSKHFIRYDLERSERFRAYAEAVRGSYHEES